MKNSFRNTIGVSNSLDPDQARHFVEPDLGPNCLQKLSADKARVKVGMVFGKVLWLISTKISCADIEDLTPVVV